MPARSVENAMVAVAASTIDVKDEAKKQTTRVRTDAFMIMTTPVTRALYTAVMGTRGQDAGGPRRPCTDVSWNDAVAFCNALSVREGRTPAYTECNGGDALSVQCDFTTDGYRLPTEAEWEVACRAGSDEVRYGELDDIAWHRGNSRGKLHDVGIKAPNAWGLYDTIGLVWEWCWNLYDPEEYGPYRTFRGGGFEDVPRALRASCRRKSHPTFSIDDLGFRVVCTQVED